VARRVAQVETEGPKLCVKLEKVDARLVIVGHLSQK